MRRKKSKNMAAMKIEPDTEMMISPDMMEGLLDTDESDAAQGLSAFSSLIKDGEDSALKLTELIIQQDGQSFPNEQAVFALYTRTLKHITNTSPLRKIIGKMIPEVL